MDYLVIFEKGLQGYGAYVPDLPGCVAAGNTLDEVRDLIREAIPLHVYAMREHGEPVPSPTSVADTVRVAG
jgi:predicted RNase H-like HicB family nuclease